MIPYQYRNQVCFIISSVSFAYKTKKRIKFMDEFEDNKSKYLIRPKSAKAVTIGLKLDSLPKTIPNIIVARTQQDLQRNFFDKAKIECSKLRGGDVQITIIKKDPNLDLLEVLNTLDRVILEMPLPLIFYIVREKLENIVLDTEKKYSVICKIITDKEPTVLVCGRVNEALNAKKSLILCIENILGRYPFYYEGYISSEVLLKMNIRIFFLSKINNLGVVMSENKDIEHVLEEMKKTIIEGTIVLDAFKFTYLLFYCRLKLERMLGEYDCYLEGPVVLYNHKTKILIKGFKKVNIKRCFREIRNLIQEVVKIAFVEEDLKLSAHEVFVFQVRNKANEDKVCFSVRGRDGSENDEIYKTRVIYDRSFESNIYTELNENISKSENSAIKEPDEIANSNKNESPKSSSSPWYIDKTIDNMFATCKKHNKTVPCDCQIQTNKWGQYIQENHRYIGIGLRNEIKRMLMHSNLLYEVEIDIEPELEDFLCGKKNGKINKISKDSESEVFITSRVDNGERRIVIYLSGPGQYIKSALMALEDEYPAELSFYLDEKHHRRIIGYGGKTIQKIMKKHGVYIKFMGFDEWSKQGLPGNVIIKTPKRNLESLMKMKEEVLALAEEKCEVGELPRQYVSIYTFYELFIENADLCFDHIVLYVLEKPRIYLIEPYEMHKLGNIPGSKFVTLNNKRFLFTTKVYDFDILTQDKWLGWVIPQEKIFNSVLLYSYEPTFKNKDEIDFTDKICKPNPMCDDEFTVGKRKRDDERQSK